MMNRTIEWKAPLGVLCLLFLTGCSSQPKEEAPRPETVPMRPSGESSSSSGVAIGHDAASPSTPSGNVVNRPAGKALQLRWSARA